MKNILIHSMLLFTIVCHSAKAMTVPSKTDYDNFYQNLENSMPAQAYGISIFLNLTELANFNPFEQKFSACMQTAINQTFYQPTLKQNFNQYLIQVTPSDFKNDLEYISSESHQWDNHLYKNIFSEFAKTADWRENAKIAIAKQKLERPYRGKGEHLSKTYYDFFGEKSSFGKVIGSQLKECEKLQIPIK